MTAWRYLAQRLTGEAAGEIFVPELPLGDVQIDDVLSGPPGLTGKIEPYLKELVAADGRPLIGKWDTAIYAEADDELRGGGIVQGSRWNGSAWDLDIVGFTDYANGMPYTGAEYFVEVDPLDIFRHIWDHIQSHPGGNLGLILDSTTSPVRVGKELEQVQFEAETSPGVRELVSFEAGPRKLNWYQTKDLGKEIDDYSKETPFDWRETHRWDGDTIVHPVRIGYPRLGRRRTDGSRLVYGENVLTPPTVTDGDRDAYATEVVVLGAGEGRDMVRGSFIQPGFTGLRRVKVVEDKSIKSQAAATARAKRELAASRGGFLVDSLEIIEHKNLPLASVQLGDELPLYAETDWVTVDCFVRVVGRSYRPGNEDSAVLTVVRADAETV